MGERIPIVVPIIIPNNSPHSPFPHSLLRTRQDLGLIYGVVLKLRVLVWGLGFRGWGLYKVVLRFRV